MQIPRSTPCIQKDARVRSKARCFFSGAFRGASSCEVYKRLKLVCLVKMTISKYISNFSSPPRTALGKGVMIYDGSYLAVASGWQRRSFTSGCAQRIRHWDEWGEMPDPRSTRTNNETHNAKLELYYDTSVNSSRLPTERQAACVALQIFRLRLGVSIRNAVPGTAVGDGLAGHNIAHRLGNVGAMIANTFDVLRAKKQMRGI